MKVIFLEDVPGVAKASEVKEIAGGYARNYLFPRKLAVVAKPGAVRLVEQQRKVAERRQQEEAAGMLALAQELEGREISLEAKVGANDRLYGSITSADIAAGLENTVGLTVDKRKIELDEPIHQLGSYEVVIRLAKDVTPKIKVNVVEGETKQS